MLTLKLAMQSRDLEWSLPPMLKRGLGRLKSAQESVGNALWGHALVHVLVTTTRPAALLENDPVADVSLVD